jgi:hypothetical protein
MAHKLTKKQLEKIRQIVQQSVRPTPSKPRFDWKVWAGIAIGILGLILGALGLRARPTVSLESPLDPKDILTTPFVISNDGMLDLENIEVQTFLIQIQYQNLWLERKSIGLKYFPPSKTLGIGERETVPLARLIKPTYPVITADVALIVTFTPQFLPFMRKTKVFRFITIRQPDGLLRLEQEPASDALEEYREVIRKAKQNFDLK